MRNSSIFVALAATALFILGCASKEEPAKQVVANAEASLAPLREQATVYAPDQLKVAEDNLAAAKENITWQKYQEILDKAPELNQSITTLKDAVVAKQTQVAAATHEWEALTEEVPKLVEAIQSRVDTLSKSRLPKDVKKESFEAAKASLEEMKTTWAKATAAFSGGDPTAAADMGRTVQAKAKEVSAQLAMNAA